MEWVEPLRGKKVGLDTAPFIYYIEEHPTYLPLLEPFFAAVTDGEIQVVTSTMTLLEVLILPIRRGESDLVERYRRMLLNTKGIETVSATPTIVGTAAELRARHNILPPDAIQLATAIRAETTHFLTNDTRLPSPASVRLLILDELLS